MDQKRLVRASRYIARVLRHDPDRVGVRLDPRGWTPVDDLLRGLRRADVRLGREELEEVVAGNDKKRFEFSADGTRIRARQGHSVSVDPGLVPTEPPETLYHGTVGRFMPAITAEGLRPMNRHDVHLAPDTGTAARVGARRGRPVVLAVAAGRMHRDGHGFRVTGNGVWLVAAVPPGYLSGTAPVTA
ncbi:RNA 2'-phosphotransferase [Nocardiopsis sp. N85]|uniref:RNA 2'-phosphotransferase n=1 Tax=Nocardiopsis sp. N85 TaxID=3029400 RepID=UPI00237F05D7|nr:RNA 2'-phosphotransferase [Nocardiopsis sp. N85]MDE3725149.1 RNA 2'-phosphotransferase [Nocardiopsis sp. N85]